MRLPVLHDRHQVGEHRLCAQREHEREEQVWTLGGRQRGDLRRGFRNGDGTISKIPARSVEAPVAQRCAHLLGARPADFGAAARERSRERSIGWKWSRPDVVVKSTRMPGSAAYPGALAI